MNDRVAVRRSASTDSETGPGWEVVITLTTPDGAPARRRTSATHSAVSGVSAAGLRTAVQPAARAGASFLVAIAAGKFQGVIMYATPIGWWLTMIVLSPWGARRKSPGTRDASSLNQRKNSAAYAASPIASLHALPFSSTINRAHCWSSADMIS